MFKETKRRNTENLPFRGIDKQTWLEIISMYYLHPDKKKVNRLQIMGSNSLFNKSVYLQLHTRGKPGNGCIIVICHRLLLPVAYSR